MKPKDFTQGQVAPLTEALAMLSSDETAFTHLEAACVLKRAEQYLEAVRKRLRALANSDYETLTAAHPEEKKIPVAEIAVVTAYTPRSKWEYPPELLKELQGVRGKLKAAEMDGSAKRITPELDPTTTALFSITVTAKA